MADQLCRECKQVKPVCCGSGRADDSWCWNFCKECCEKLFHHEVECHCPCGNVHYRKVKPGEKIVRMCLCGLPVTPNVGDKHVCQ